MTYQEQAFHNMVYCMLSRKQSQALKSRKPIQLTEEEVEVVLEVLKYTKA